MTPTNAPNPDTLAPLVWHTEVRRLADLVPYDKNPRKISRTQFAKLKKSLKEDGYHARIAISLEGVIIAGHMRHKAMLEMKWEEAEVLLPSRPLTTEEFDRINLRDNVSFGQFDLEVLSRFEPSYLVDLGLTLDMPSLAHPKGEPVKDPDETPATPTTARTQPGDLYEIGQHRLLCGDATLPDAVVKLMGGTLAEMCFTDPPYNVAYVGKTKDALTIQNDKMGDASFRAFLDAAMANAANSVKPGGALYVAHADTEGINFRAAMIGAGFKLASCICWVKPSMVMGRSDYQWRHEPILYGWKEGAPHRWRGDRAQTTVWEIDRPSRSAEHPTMKPVALIEIALRNSSLPGELVLDLFGGSGSTMVTAHKNGRSCNTLELDPKYCDVIVSRMLDIYPDLQGALKLNGEVIQWPSTQA